MDTPLTWHQQSILERLDDYLDDAPPHYPVKDQCVPLVLAKYSKYIAVFRLWHNEQPVCSFHRTCHETEWTVIDSRCEETRQRPVSAYRVNFELYPVVWRSGVSTALFHAMNQLSMPPVDIHYPTQRQAGEAFERWQKESYCKVEKFAISSSRRGHTKSSLAVRYSLQCEKPVATLQIYEDVPVEQVEWLHRYEQTVYVCCVDTRRKRAERGHLEFLERQGHIQLQWCESDPLECMAIEECEQLLQLLNACEDPLSTVLLSRLAP